MTMILTRPPDNGRGCGYRDEEMPYLCTGLSSSGMPLEHFILDPAPVYDDVWQRGYALVEMAGITHIVIFVSSETYPSPWDFFAEAKAYGVSRKMPKNFPFHVLTPRKSKMYFAHKRAVAGFDYRIKAPVYQEGQSGHMTRLHGCKWKPSQELCESEKYSGDQPSHFWPWFETPTGYHPPEAEEKCTFALKELACLVHETNKAEGYELAIDGNRFRVNGPSFDYSAYVPDKPNKIEWQAGIFLATYVTHVEYAKTADEGSAGRAADAGFDVKVVDW